MLKLVDLQFDKAVLLVGRRLAETLMLRHPYQNGWSRLAMLSRGFFDVEIDTIVPRSSFEPAPRTDGALVTISRKDAKAGWRRDAVGQSYRAMIKGDEDDSTVAKSLKTVVVDRQGNAEARPIGKKKDVNRSSRRAGKMAMRNFKAQLNYGVQDTQERSSPPEPIKTMHGIISSQVDPKILSRPLSGMTNYELQKVCSAINAAINVRQKQ